MKVRLEWDSLVWSKGHWRCRYYRSPWDNRREFWRLSARTTAKQCSDAIIDAVFDGVRNLDVSE